MSNERDYEDVDAPEAVEPAGETAPDDEESGPEETGDLSEAEGGAEAERTTTPEEVAAVAQEFVEGLIEAMGLTAEVATRTEGRRAYVDVTGEDLGLLIGRRGQTLDALQEVVRTAVQRRLRARAGVLVDVEGYRVRRQASLAEYARAMARRAQERGTEIELEAMNSYERKIVHDAVSEVEGATSFSEGEEPERKVIVRGE